MGNRIAYVRHVMVNESLYLPCENSAASKHYFVPATNKITQQSRARFKPLTLSSRGRDFVRQFQGVGTACTHLAASGQAAQRATMVLTERQRQELHTAVLGYLESMGFKAASVAFQADSGCSTDAEERPRAAGGDDSSLLERRWTSILRLQKRIADLEAQLSDLQSSSRTAEKRARGGEVITADFVPRDVQATLAGHRKAVTCLAIHPLYSLALSGSEDATLRLWDLDTGACERSLTGHTGAISDAAFDSSGLLLASCSSDASIKLWDFGWTSSVKSGAGEGSAPASAAGPGVMAAGARPASYACVSTLHGHDGPVSGVCFIPGAARLLSCSRDGTIGVWDCESGHCLRRLGGAPGAEWIRRVAVNAAGTVAASCSNDKVRPTPSADMGRGTVDRRVSSQWRLVGMACLPSGRFIMRAAITPTPL